MTINRTAFQVSAFQRNGFQIATAVLAGTGDIPPWLLAAIARSNKRKKKKEEPVTIDEVVEAVAEIRTRLNIRAVTPPRSIASLAPVEAAARVRARSIADAQFRAEVAELDAILAADEWDEAA